MRGRRASPSRSTSRRAAATPRGRRSRTLEPALPQAAIGRTIAPPRAKGIARRIIGPMDEDDHGGFPPVYMPMADVKRRSLGICVFILINLFLAAVTVYRYRNPSKDLGLVEQAIRRGPLREERLGTKLMVFGMAVAGALVLIRNRPLGFGLMGTSYLVDAARLALFHVREGERLLDAHFLAPWMM